MSRRGARALILVLPTLLLAGCLTGKRGYFADDPFPKGAPTGDANVDAVLSKLDAVTQGPVTAAYTVLTKYGNVTHPASVVLSPGERSVSVGNIRYVQTAALAKTCTVDNSSPCTNGFDASKISDTLATVDFYAADTAKSLRREVTSKIGPTVARTLTIAGQQATCVDVPVSGGTAVYCVLSDGMLAKLDDGAVLITLTSYSATADPTQFVPPGS